MPTKRSQDWLQFLRETRRPVLRGRTGLAGTVRVFKHFLWLKPVPLKWRYLVSPASQ
jgi:hypothetical protein